MVPPIYGPFILQFYPYIPLQGKHSAWRLHALKEEIQAHGTSDLRDP
jgi:hypothetical protein